MTSADFAGSDYLPLFDRKRLATQHTRVVGAALGERWKTLQELARETGAPPASVSAQLRHSTKNAFGSYVLEKRSRGAREDGLFEYRLRPPGTPTEQKRRRSKVAQLLAEIGELRAEVARLRAAGVPVLALVASCATAQPTPDYCSQKVSVGSVEDRRVLCAPAILADGGAK